MHYRSKDRSIVHKEVDWIFRKLLLENGLSVREEQIRLCHEMIDALWDGKIILCDAYERDRAKLKKPVCEHAPVDVMPEVMEYGSAEEVLEVYEETAQADPSS